MNRKHSDANDLLSISSFPNKYHLFCCYYKHYKLTIFLILDTIISVWILLDLAYGYGSTIVL